jgi:HEAT repeat protein
MAYMMNYPISAEKLEPFLATNDMHVQISAVRALAGGQLPDKAERLMGVLEDDHANMTARIMATVLLREIDAHSMKQRLLEYSQKAPKDESGLGVAIMDPRIGTWFPQTLAEAAKEIGGQL